jgi:hypothetical protein
MEELFLADYYDFCKHTKNKNYQAAAIVVRDLMKNGCDRDLNDPDILEGIYHMVKQLSDRYNPVPFSDFVSFVALLVKRTNDGFPPSARRHSN